MCISQYTKGIVENAQIVYFVRNIYIYIYFMCVHERIYFQNVQSNKNNLSILNYCN